MGSWSYVIDISDATFSIIPDHIPTTQRDALIALYNATDGDNWNNNTNWRKPGDPTQFNDPGTEYTWYGVTVTNYNTNVTGIDLGYNNLTGSIPDFSAFPDLVILDLAGNNLSGSIPVEIGNITYLVQLELQENLLTGTIPPEIGNLVHLDKLLLDLNGLVGDLPATLSNLTNLAVEGLNIRYNGLYTADTNLKAFLDSRQYGGYWDSLQTVAPTELSVESVAHDSVTLAWTPIQYTDGAGEYQVYYSTTAGSGFALAGATFSKTVGTYTVTGLSPTTQYYFKIRTVTTPTLSNRNTLTSEFTSEVTGTTIPTPTITVTSPNGGETWEGTTAQTVTWTSTGDITQVKIDFSIDNGVTWDTLSILTANDGSYGWSVPNTPSTSCLVRVTDYNDVAQDTSDAVFTIAPKRTVTVTSPNGGESWEGNTTQSITWTTTGTIANVLLEYTIDNGTTWNTIIASTSNTGSYNWTVPNTPSASCLVRVTDTDGTAKDTSNAVFTIALQRTVTLTSPNGGESWEGNTSQSITWTTTGAISNVSLEYTIDNGTTWNTITASTSNSGSYSWTVPNTPSASCLVRVTDTDGAAQDTSDAVFTIALQRTVTLTSPNGGETWEGNTDNPITWTSTGNITSVKIEYSIDSGSTWNTIAASTANNGTYNWTVPNTPSASCLVRVTDSNGTAQDTSDAVFTIAPQRTIAITSPNGGESWEVASTHTISWNYTGNITYVTLEYSNNSGVTWKTINYTVANTGSYSWTIPDDVSTDCLVRVTDKVSLISDVSDVTFTIAMATIPQAERDALIALYNSTNGDSWTDNSNWRKPGDPTQFNDPGTEYTWFGITCDDNHTHVTHIDIGLNNLSGTIPDLSALTELVWLKLIHGNITGSIPATIANLTKLQTLTLEDNQLTGTIPDLSTLSNLTYLSLAHNQLTGSVPSWLNYLTGLTSLYLQDNQLSGSLPDMSSLTQLRNFRIYDNQLTGNLPTTFNQMTSLNWVEMQGNQLSGTLPDLSNLTALTYLSLADNQFSGSVPDLSTLTSLTHLNLSDNQLSGTIPTWIGNLTSLNSLYLNGNLFSGSIPSEIGALTSLLTLYLQGNQFSGDIPGSMSNLTNLSSYGLNIAYNALYTADSTLRDFLNTHQYDRDWEATQTITPTGISAVEDSDTSVTVSWTPITYQDDSGGYRVYYSTTSGSGYTLAGTTTDKTIDNYTVTGLSENTLYYFVVRTVTSAHADNQSTLISETSTEVSATTQETRTLELVTPNGGESWEGNTTQTITWTGTGSIANVSLEYTLDNGTTWNTIISSTANTGSYNWTVPNSPSTQCSIRITSGAGTETDQSDALFTIVAERTLSLTAPNGSETLEGTTAQTITWNSTGTIPNVKLEYTIDNGGTWVTIEATTPNDGSYNWTVPNTPSAQCLVRISDLTGPAIDTSDALFTIVALRTLAVVTPNGGESWEGNTSQAITWTSTGSIASVKIEYSIDNGSTWSTIAASTANDGTYSWLVANTPSTSCLVKVSDIAGPAVDSSNGVFTIVAERTLSVISPNGGETWEGNSLHNILWGSTGAIANVKIEYSTDNGSTWTTLTASTANDGSFAWTVNNTPSTTCLIRISDTAGTAVDSSTGVFTIEEQRTLTVTAPNGGESWRRNTFQTITWNSTGDVGNVNISYSTDSGTTWTFIASSTATAGSYSWLIPKVKSDLPNCLVKIAAVSGSCEDTSDNYFTLSKF